MSKKKTLLAERTVRRFMALANIPVMREAQPVGGPYARDEEEELESELGATEDELGAEDRLADEEGEELGLDMDLGDELGDEVEGEEAVSALSQELAAEIAPVIEDFLGQSADVSVEGEVDVPVVDVEDVDVDLPGPLGGEEDIDVEEEDVLDVPMAETVTGQVRKTDDPSGRRVAFERGKTGTKRGPFKRDSVTAPPDPEEEKRLGLTEDSGEEEGDHDWRNEHADDDHIREIERHLDALRHDRDYEGEHVREGTKKGDKDKTPSATGETGQEAFGAPRAGDEDESGKKARYSESLVNEIAARVAARLLKRS